MLRTHLSYHVLDHANSQCSFGSLVSATPNDLLERSEVNYMPMKIYPLQIPIAQAKINLILGSNINKNRYTVVLLICFSQIWTISLSYPFSRSISFYRCSFDPVHGGEMLQQEYVRFLKTESRPGQGCTDSMSSKFFSSCEKMKLECLAV